MPSRTLPGIGLKGFWTLGEDGWKAENDTNLLTLSALVVGRALDHVSTTPASPTDGQIYLFSSTHATQANKIAIRDNGAWVHLTPQSGWQMYDVTAAAIRRFSGTQWTIVAGSTTSQAFQITLSDMTTSLTTGTSKGAWIVPFTGTVSEVFTAVVGSQSTSGNVTVDAKIGGTSIFSTLPSIDPNEDASLTGVAAVVSTTSLTKGQIIKFDVTSAGTGAKGLVITIVLVR